MVMKHPWEYEGFRAAVTIILVVGIIAGMAWYEWTTEDYSQLPVKNNVCNKLLSGSRFTQCKKLGNTFSSEASEGVVRVCQMWGKTNITNQTLQYKYCDDYHYELQGSNITIRRVR